MSESDSFIREVTEEVERDRMNRQVKKWGPWIGAGVLALVGLAGAWQWQQDRDRQAAEELGRILLSEDLEQTETAANARDLVTGPPAVFADMRIAAAQIAEGDPEAAIETYRAIAGRGDIDPAYGDLAALRAARLAAVSGDPAEVIAMLDPLTAEGRPYRVLARELRAVLLLNTGETETALGEFRALLTDPDSPAGLTVRVRDLLRATGQDAEE